MWTAKISIPILFVAASFFIGTRFGIHHDCKAEEKEMSETKHVTGVGGVFFKAEDPKKLREWYAKHLGITPTDHGSVIFTFREDDNPDKRGYLVWGPFPESTKYFDPSTKPFMFNYRVRDLDGLLAKLRAAGVTVDDKVEEYEYGRFGWAVDLEGNRIELWEPAGPVPSTK